MKEAQGGKEDLEEETLRIFNKFLPSIEEPLKLELKWLLEHFESKLMGRNCQ